MTTPTSPQEKITQALKWLGTAFTLLGATLTAAAMDPYNVWCLNVGSIWFLWWAWRIRDTAMITVNGGLLFIYAIGTVRTLIYLNCC